jgi:hypothetical protein
MVHSEATGFCVGRDYGFGSIVCVDTVKHCGLPGVLPAMASNQLLMVTSDKAGLRWQETYYKWKTFRGESMIYLAILSTREFNRLKDIVPDEVTKMG